MAGGLSHDSNSAFTVCVFVRLCTYEQNHKEYRYYVFLNTGTPNDNNYYAFTFLWTVSSTDTSFW